MKKYVSKFTVLLAILTIIGSIGFVSCEQKSKEKTTYEKMEYELEMFKEDIEDLSEDDPEFVDKLDKKLAAFNLKMERLKEEAKENGEKAENKLDKSIDKIQNKAKELSNKVASLADKSEEKINEITDSIKEDFNNLKQEVKTTLKK